MFSNWRGRGVVAEFRASIGDRFGDPDLFRLSESLSRDSKNFKSCGGTRGVLEREGGQRTFGHPIDGLPGYEQVTLSVDAHSELKWTILRPRLGAMDGDLG
jgi:hypothetical protein